MLQRTDYELVNESILEVNDLARIMLLSLCGAASKNPTFRRIFFQQPLHFGIAEQFVHLAQSGRFALSFLTPAVDPSQPTFVLPEVFHPVLRLPSEPERRAALSKINLDGAREKAATFGRKQEDVGALYSWWEEAVSKQQRSVGMLFNFEHDSVIQHPLVSLEKPLTGMVLKLFTEHTRYHLGQVAEALKWESFGDLVPFPFGEFNRTMAA